MKGNLDQNVHGSGKAALMMIMPSVCKLPSISHISNTNTRMHIHVRTVLMSSYPAIQRPRSNLQLAQSLSGFRQQCTGHRHRVRTCRQASSSKDIKALNRRRMITRTKSKFQSLTRMPGYHVNSTMLLP